MIKHIEDQKEIKRKIVEEARKNNMLQECGCCYNDECLLDDMLPCREGHHFCIECVQRASEVSNLIDLNFLPKYLGLIQNLVTR